MTWLWGDFIACIDCGKRYLSPQESLHLQQEAEAVADDDF